VVEPERAGTGETVRITAGFLLSCTGYYRYDEGYTPELPGIERFGGPVIHPQHWPEDLDYAGRRVVVIGSGATAVTLVPAMAGEAEHVTMLQRSPSYVVSLPGEDAIANAARRVLPAKAAYALVRWKNVLITTAFFQLSRRAPRRMRALIRRGVVRHLPADLVDTHFNPTYDPWDQRVCLVPDGNLFEAVASGRASIVTDRIETVTERGVQLVSGRELEADIIVTATGLNLLALGGMDLEVDGRAVAISETVGYKGMMLSGVPNLVIAIGYTNASWTLKADLTSEYVCRLLQHMDAGGHRRVVAPTPDPSMPTRPFIDLDSGYVRRAVDRFPRQGTSAPWRLYQNYLRDIIMLRFGDVDDGVLQFSAGAPAAEPPAERLAA
jgi:cation diffusion facilitator CzcD-associated flavoprotein CzcO